jgi:hypothetical protein
MKLFRRDSEEDPMAPYRSPDSRISTTIAQTEVQPSDDEDDEVDAEHEKAVQEIMDMSSDELFRDAADDIAYGDEEEDIDEATSRYARAAAVAQLAVAKALQKTGE